ncbi:methyltransferase [Thermopolyspora sp. NPDC052614]|uniref:class I SAM-dependent methyltransferase n=1 Tax=Thermopolyspora sp. NPDC052614 TaxID=3155682 RepID=UPI003417422F
MHQHTHPGHDHDDPHDHGDDGQAEILDLDAEVLAEHIASITAWLPLTSEPRRIVDLGYGTGAGTFALLERFPYAHVTAVDAAVGYLKALREKACARGVEERVWTVQADLDADRWPDLGTPDLVWASASMHHMADPGRTLRKVRELLAPGGLFAVVELAGFPRFLPAHAPENRPGLEERVHAAADALYAEHVPHRGADWGRLLVAAGFTVEDQRTITVDMDGNTDGDRDEAIARYAHVTLQRIRGVAAGTLSPEDLAALDEILDPDNPTSLLRREDLVVRTERTIWAARRA